MPSSDLLVDTIVMMLETPGPRAASDTDVYHWHPVRERVQPVLLQGGATDDCGDP